MRLSDLIGMLKRMLKSFSNLTIDQYLKKKKYSNYYIYNHLYPMAGSIWSSKVGDIKNYPFEKFVSFLQTTDCLKFLIDQNGEL